MKRDITVSVADKDGYITYEMLPTHKTENVYEAFAHRYLKILLSNKYGGLLYNVRKYRTEAIVALSAARADEAIKRLASTYPDSVYAVYSSYIIKTLDINAATSSLLLEVELVFKGGNTMIVRI